MLESFTMYKLIFAIFIRIVANPLGNVFQKKLSQEGVSSLVINFMSFFLLSLVCIFASFGVGWHGFSAELWKNAVIASLLGVIGCNLIIKAIQMGELSVLGPVNSYKSIVGMVAGIFLLGEMPSFAGVLGMILIIAGSYFVFETQEEKFSLKIFLRKDILCRLMALVFSAVEAVFIKKVIILSSMAVAFSLWCWFGAIFSFVILLFSGKEKYSQLKKPDFGLYLPLVLCIGAMQFSTTYVFQKMNVGYALALFQLSTLITVFLGYKIFHEKDIFKKLVGTIIMIAGAVIIILT